MDKTKLLKTVATLGAGVVLSGCENNESQSPQRPLMGAFAPAEVSPMFGMPADDSARFASDVSTVRQFQTQCDEDERLGYAYINYSGDGFKETDLVLNTSEVNVMEHFTAVSIKDSLVIKGLHDEGAALNVIFDYCQDGQAPSSAEIVNVLSPRALDKASAVYQNQGVRFAEGYDSDVQGFSDRASEVIATPIEP